MLTRHLEVRPGCYRDSVRLMQLSREVAGEPGVAQALVAMATELNLDLLAGLGFPRPPEAGPDDLVVAVAVADPAALDRALSRVAEGLAAAPTAPGGGAGATEAAPRTVRTAARRLGANLVLVSTPGRYAFLDAMDALRAGCSVLVFSDNVPLAQEVRLKEEAARRGLLVMGPDCGTALVGGVGLGFANVVRPGPVGLVAASGTGAQQVMCLLDAAGVGVSHCLGVGGRDLREPVGGRSTLAALDLLAADPTTEVVVVVAKPPAPEVGAAVSARAADLGRPVVLALLGPGGPDLTAAAEAAVRAAGGQPPPWPSWAPSPAPPPAPGALRGLYAGGTLAEEALLLAGPRLGPIRSNVPLDPGLALGADLLAAGHVVVDFGDDQLTQGRPHPIIDWSLRLDRLAVEAQDPTCAVVLLDVLLGHAAHPDPAAELAPAVRAARATARSPLGGSRELAVVVALVGSPGDPQDRDRQAGELSAAGAHVFASHAAAVHRAAALATGAAR